MSVFDHIRFAVKSDIGKKRKNNEDAYGIFPESGIFCVADGMGGGDDGEVASAATVREVQCFCESHKLPPQLTYTRDDILAGIRASVNTASAWIFRRTKERGLKGCGSTFVGVVFDAARPDQAVALHAGDSRLYRIRGRTIQQITIDHSAAELIGAKNEKDINPMFRGMILRAVGIQPSVELQATEFPVREGDRVLICSDGLSRMVPDKQLLSIVRANGSPQVAVDALVAAANAAGGVDNITVELIEIGQLPIPIPAIPLQVAPPSSDAPDEDSSTSVTWTGINGTETVDATSANGSVEPFESETEELFSAAPTIGFSDDDSQTCSTVTVPEAQDEVDDASDPGVPTPSNAPISGKKGSRSRRWIWCSFGIVLVLGAITGLNYVQRAKFQRIRLQEECASAVKAVEDAFAAADNENTLNAASENWKGWQEKWKQEQALDKTVYAEFVARIQAAREAAAHKIAGAKAAERAAVLKKECEAAAAKLKGVFQSATDEAGLAAAEKALQAWRDEWKPQKVDGYAGLNEEMQTARDGAMARVEKAELARKMAVCREAAAVVARAFGSVATRQELDKADAARRDWQGRWKELTGEAGYKEADGGIAGARADAEKHLAEIEQKRQNILKIYNLALTDEPVASRRKRLEDAKGMLEASRKEKLFAEEETGRRLAEIEARLAWTVGVIENRAAEAVVFGADKVSVQPGGTLTVVFKKGTSWTVTRRGYKPITVTREELDGKTVTLEPGRWKALPAQKSAEPQKPGNVKKPEALPKKQVAAQTPVKEQKPSGAKKPDQTVSKAQAERFIEELRQVVGENELLERFEAEVKKLGVTGMSGTNQYGEIISLLDQIAENLSEVAEQELQVVGVDENEQDQVNSRKERYTALHAACNEFFDSKGNGKRSNISRMKNFFDAVEKASTLK